MKLLHNPYNQPRPLGSMKQKTNKEIMIMESMNEQPQACSSQEYVLENVVDTIASNEGKQNKITKSPQKRYSSTKKICRGGGLTSSSMIQHGK